LIYDRSPARLGRGDRRGSSLIGYFGLSQPTYDDCRQLTTYSNSAIAKDRNRAGRWFCVMTTEDRLGSFGIEAKDGTDNILTVTVWAKDTDVH
jgi:hypothetical protein